MPPEANAPWVHVIRSRANPDLVLAAFNGQIVLEWLDLNNRNQQWYWDPVGGTFANQGARGSIGVIDVAAGNRLLLHNEHLAWEVAGDHIRPVGYPGFVVSIDGGNLNLGTPAALATDIGQPWQKWDVVLHSDIQPPATRKIRLLATPHHSLRAFSSHFVLGLVNWPQGVDLHTLITWSQGFAIYSETMGRFLGSAGADRMAVGYPLMCVEALWTFSSLEPGAWVQVSPWGSDSLVLQIEGSPRIGADVVVVEAPEPAPDIGWQVVPA